MHVLTGIDYLISLIVGAGHTAPPALFLKNLRNLVYGILILVMPEDQFVKAAAAIAANQIDCGFKRPSAFKHYTVSAAAHASRVALDAVGEAGALGVN
jgi:hypothetical protein